MSDEKVLQKRLNRAKEIIRNLLMGDHLSYGHYLHMKHYYGEAIAQEHSNNLESKCSVCKALLEARQFLEENS